MTSTNATSIEACETLNASDTLVFARFLTAGASFSFQWDKETVHTVGPMRWPNGNQEIGEGPGWVSANTRVIARLGR